MWSAVTSPQFSKEDTCYMQVSFLILHKNQLSLQPNNEDPTAPPIHRIKKNEGGERDVEKNSG